MHPNDPADPTDLLRASPADDADEADAKQAADRFTVHSEWSMVRVSKKRWFGR